MIDACSRSLSVGGAVHEGHRGRLPSVAQGEVSAMAYEAIFQPLRFRNLTVKNRIFGRTSRDDSTTTTGRAARPGSTGRRSSPREASVPSSRRSCPCTCVGASCRTAMIDHDRHSLLARGRQSRPRARLQFILQLSHSGRQRDINGIEYPTGLSSTSKADPIMGSAARR